MVFEWLAVFDLWKNALVSPLEIGVEGVRCGIRRLVRWEQIARAELWHSPFGKGHHLRFFDPRNRKIGFVAILHDGAEWNDALDCLRARAVSST